MVVQLAGEAAALVVLRGEHAFPQPGHALLAGPHGHSAWRLEARLARSATSVVWRASMSWKVPHTRDRWPLSRSTPPVAASQRRPSTGWASETSSSKLLARGDRAEHRLAQGASCRPARSLEHVVERERRGPGGRPSSSYIGVGPVHRRVARVELPAGDAPGPRGAVEQAGLALPLGLVGADHVEDLRGVVGDHAAAQHVPGGPSRQVHAGLELDQVGGAARPAGRAHGRWSSDCPGGRSRARPTEQRIGCDAEHRLPVRGRLRSVPPKPASATRSSPQQEP